jgi:hypothetical protein
MSNTQVERTGGFSWRIAGWGGAGLLLLLPLVAGAPWTLSDYVIAALMLGVAGGAIELGVRMSRDPFYRAGAGVAVLAAFLLVWVNGAVGFLGDEDNPANLMFAGVIAVALVGATVARFRAPGVARAMLAAAGAQLLVGILALAFGLGSPGAEGWYEVLMGTTLFGGLWLIAAGLFRKAAERA